MTLESTCLIPKFLFAPLSSIEGSATSLRGNSRLSFKFFVAFHGFSARIKCSTTRFSIAHLLKFLMRSAISSPKIT